MVCKWARWSSITTYTLHECSCPEPQHPAWAFLKWWYSALWRRILPPPEMAESQIHSLECHSRSWMGANPAILLHHLSGNLFIGDSQQVVVISAASSSLIFFFFFLRYKLLSISSSYDWLESWPSPPASFPFGPFCKPWVDGMVTYHHLSGHYVWIWRPCKTPRPSVQGANCCPSKRKDTTFVVRDDACPSKATHQSNSSP